MRTSTWSAVSELPETLTIDVVAVTGTLPRMADPTPNPVPATTTTATSTNTITATSLASSSRIRPTGRVSR